MAQSNKKPEICSKWKELSASMPHNFIDSKGAKKRFLEHEFFGYLIDSCKGRKIAISAGHFIPNLKNYDGVGRNPVKTWETACKFASTLKMAGKDVQLTLLSNDILIPKEERPGLFSMYGKLPGPFSEIMEMNGLDARKDLAFYYFNGNGRQAVFSEKKLSNRMTYWVKRKKTVPEEFWGEGHCQAALLNYMMDFSKRDVGLLACIYPKCSWPNVDSAIGIFEKTGAEMKIACFYQTDNCFQ